MGKVLLVKFGAERLQVRSLLKRVRVFIAQMIQYFGVGSLIISKPKVRIVDPVDLRIGAGAV